jgi:CRISPR/Cas system-associated exonuclease Cas4 (RecB family)
MNAEISCSRKHYWGNEIGLTKTEVGVALRIGSAWARAMEARWHGKTYEQALIEAIPDGIELNAYDCAIVSALLAAYYEVYGRNEKVGKLHPEVEITPRELGVGDFIVRGKLDGLGSLKDGRSVIIESKTTSARLDASSDYWLRLSFNLQVLQYLSEARQMGWDIAVIFYDVTRKPMIRPCEINSLDSKGLKIVIDKNGKRIYKTKKVTLATKVGKKKGVAKKIVKEVEDLNSPRQSGDESKGWFVKSHTETPDEYCDRVYKDALARPDFYFARREIPVIDQQLVAFELQREAIARRILRQRQDEEGLVNPEDAWLRNVSEHTCNFCQFKSFCLSNIHPNINNPPEGFEVRGFNPELERTEPCESDSQNESVA